MKKIPNIYPSCYRLIMLTAFILGNLLLHAQEPLPRGWERKVRAQYERLTEKGVSYTEFLKAETAEYQRIAALKKGQTTVYTPQPSQSVCGNGDFESGNIDPNEWTGAYGSINTTTRDPDWLNLTSGLSSGPVTAGNARQTIASTGTDPNVGIATTHGGSYALRIGNQATGRQTELISKTFTVVPEHTIIRFWYAVVLNDPQTNHQNDERPSFWVRAIDESDGSPISGVVDLGNPVQPDKIWADVDNDDFLESVTVNGRLITYRDWTCAEINLSAPEHLGKTVTVQFITEDCSQWTHFGYAYLDDFCSTSCQGSPDGWLAFDEESSDCEDGTICFTYGLPDNGLQTGTCQITLEFLQDGTVFHTETSPVLTNNDGQYCFQVNPCGLPGVDPSPGGFDFYAEADFSFEGAPLPPKTVGSHPDGTEPGQNNDCDCGTTHDFEFDPCCPPMNEDFLLSLFQHVPTGTLSEPYHLEFTEDPLFATLSQAYLDYLYLLYPNIDKLAFHWRIMEAGTDPTPNGVWSASPQELYTWFLPGGGGVHHNTAPFFTADLEVGQWYWIHVGIFTDPDVDAFDADACFGDMRVYYRAEFINGRIEARISDGKRILRRIPVLTKKSR